MVHGIPHDSALLSVNSMPGSEGHMPHEPARNCSPSKLAVNCCCAGAAHRCVLASRCGCQWHFGRGQGRHC